MCCDVQKKQVVRIVQNPWSLTLSIAQVLAMLSATQRFVAIITAFDYRSRRIEPAP